MADSDLHYLTYDPDEIWDAALDAYIDAGGDVLYGGDEKEMLLRGVQAALVRILADADNSLRMATLRYAQGDYLKALGEERGCAYLDARSAAGQLEIKLLAGYAPRVIPQGTTFTPDGVRFFAISDDISYVGNEMTLTMDVVCTEPGLKGNGVEPGVIMTPVKSLPMVLSARVTAPTTGGSEAEDMEDYRERVRQAPFLSVTTGPQEQYRALALTASSAILDARAAQGEPGEVVITLVIADGADAEAVIREVAQALSAEDRRPLTDKVTVRRAEEFAYHLEVEVELGSALGAVWEDMVKAAAQYRAWQEETLGQPFDAYQLISALYRAGASRVTIDPKTSWMGEKGIQPGYQAVGELIRVKGDVILREAEVSNA